MKTVLIADDNIQIRNNVAEILELAGYCVLTAENGKDGISQTISGKPDLIICDVMMPVLDGYAMFHMLQKNDDLQNIPFIFLTAKTEHTDIRKGMELGADDYLTKPFSGTELLNSVECRLKKMDQLKTKFKLNIESTIGEKEAIENLLYEGSFTNYKKRQVIYSENKNPLRLFYIQSGKIKTFKTTEDGKELIINIFKEGDFFGYTAALDDTEYKENAVAMEDSDIVSINKSAFRELVDSNPEVSKKFIKILTKNITETEERLINTAYNSVRKKVANTLLIINNKYQENSEPFAINMSRENLAAIAGIAKESFIRTLSDFKDENLIKIDQSNIEIINPKKLQQMAN